MFCKNCGNKISDNMTFCPKCGTMVNRSVPSQNDSNFYDRSNSTETSKNFMFCKNCGNEIEDDETFCNKCGTMVNGSVPLQNDSNFYDRSNSTETSKNFMFCKNCGNKIADNATFCPKCGTENVCAKNSSKKVLLIIPALIVVIVVVLIVIISSSGGGYGKKSKEAAAECFWKAMAKQDVSDFLELIPEDYIDYIKDEYDLSNRELKDIAADAISDFRGVTDYIGDFDEYKMDSDEITWVRSILKEYGVQKLSNNVYIIDVEIEVGRYTDEEDTVVMEIGDKWYSIQAIGILATQLEPDGEIAEFYDF